MANVYEMVTDRIIKQLEQGVIPWRKTWSGVRGGAYNRVSKKTYSLINQIMLLHEGEYASYKQWQSLGGQVRKGEKSEMVVFWRIVQVDDTDENGDPVKKNVPVLRYYNVFHISQVDGVEPLDKPVTSDIEPIEAAENVLMDWVEQAGQSKIPQLQKMAMTLLAHRRGILAWYDCHISTAKVEGINNKIKVMKRNAYGFRDEEYFKLRLYALHDCHITRNVG